MNTGACRLPPYRLYRLTFLSCIVLVSTGACRLPPYRPYRLKHIPLWGFGYKHGKTVGTVGTVLANSVFNRRLWSVYWRKLGSQHSSTVAHGNGTVDGILLGRRWLPFTVGTTSIR